MRAYVVKFLGLYFFKEMTAAEMQKRIDRTLILKNGLHSEQEIADFMSKE